METIVTLIIFFLRTLSIIWTVIAVMMFYYFMKSKTTKAIMNLNWKNAVLISLYILTLYSWIV